MTREFVTRLIKYSEVAPNILYLRFQIINNIKLSFKAGQYIILTFNSLYRQYSITSSDTKTSEFDLLVELIKNGRASEYFLSLKKGATVLFQGPGGRFFLKKTTRPKLFLAFGTGIAPIKSMIESLLHQNENSQQLLLFWGVKSKKDAYFESDFALLCKKYSNFWYTYCLSQEKDKKVISERMLQGRITEHLTSYLSVKKTPISQYDIYICGNKDVVLTMHDLVIKLGAKRNNVFFERYN